jgi:hypothetical protein
LTYRDSSACGDSVGDGGSGGSGVWRWRFVVALPPFSHHHVLFARHHPSGLGLPRWRGRLHRCRSVLQSSSPRSIHAHCSLFPSRGFSVFLANALVRRACLAATPCLLFPEACLSRFGILCCVPRRSNLIHSTPPTTSTLGSPTIITRNAPMPLPCRPCHLTATSDSMLARVPDSITAFISSRLAASRLSSSPTPTPLTTRSHWLHSQRIVDPQHCLLSCLTLMLLPSTRTSALLSSFTPWLTLLTSRCKFHG